MTLRFKLCLALSAALLASTAQATSTPAPEALTPLLNAIGERLAKRLVLLVMELSPTVSEAAALRALVDWHGLGLLRIHLTPPLAAGPYGRDTRPLYRNARGRRDP